MCCLICLDWERGKMSNQEALANIGESFDGETDEGKKAHLFELADKIISKEQPFEEWESDEYTGVLGELDQAFGTEED